MQHVESSWIRDQTCLLHWQADSWPLSHQGSISFHILSVVHLKLISVCIRYPGASPVAKWLKKKKKVHLQCRRCGCDPWVWKIPWRRAWLPTPVFLPGEPHGHRSLVGYGPWGCKELDMTEVTEPRGGGIKNSFCSSFISLPLTSDNQDWFMIIDFSFRNRFIYLFYNWIIIAGDSLGAQQRTNSPQCLDSMYRIRHSSPVRPGSNPVPPFINCG